MTNNHRVTIVEIAKECGVSKTTVGDALNSEKAFRVSPQKRELVGSVAKRLGYIPNISAKTMRTMKSNIIGVMLPNPRNSFHGDIALTLQKQLTAKGYTAFFVFWNDLDGVQSINRALSTFLSHGVEGIITGELPGVHFKSSPVPVVFWQNAPSGFDSVCNLDSVKTGYQRLVKLLQKKGCANFAVFTPVMDQGRAPIILDILDKAGVSPRAEHIVKASSRATSKLAMSKVLSLSSPPPDVILCNNDAIAISAMGEAMKAGIKVPEQMKFVGFDGTDEAEFSYPSLTTFKVSVEEATDKLLELLFRRMDDRTAHPMKILIEPVLEIRESI